MITDYIMTVYLEGTSNASYLFIILSVIFGTAVPKGHLPSFILSLLKATYSSTESTFGIFTFHLPPRNNFYSDSGPLSFHLTLKLSS